jgi:hypothetical protein
MLDFILVSMFFSVFATILDLFGAGASQVFDLIAGLLEQAFGNGA